MVAETRRRGRAADLSAGRPLKGKGPAPGCTGPFRHNAVGRQSDRRELRLAAGLGTIGVLVDELQHQGADVVAPGGAGEDAVVTRTGLQVVRLHLLGDAGAQIQGGDTLAGGGNVVFLPFHGLHRHVRDLADVHLMAVDGEAVLGDLAVLEDPLDGRQVELGRHVHHRQVFVVEPVVPVMVARLAAGHAHDLVGEGLGVGVEVHRDEGGQLQQAGVDLPADALVLRPDALDHQLFQLAHADAIAEIGHLGGGGIGVDGTADQGQGARLRLGEDLG